MHPCLPDFAPWDPNYPGDPCMIVEAYDQWPTMCINCGATENPPWWNNRFTWDYLQGYRKMIEK